MKIVEAWQTKYSADGDSVHLSEHAALSHSEYEWVEEGYTIINSVGRTNGFYTDYFDAERALCEVQGGVAIGPDYIAIYDNNGEEIVTWVEDEWLEEPQLAINLANAVRTYYVKGPDFIKKLLGK